MGLLPRIYFLQEDEQLLVQSFTRRWVVQGPGRYVARALVSVRRRQGVTLGPTEYLRVRNTLSGELRNDYGPKLFMPDNPHDEVVAKLTAIPLKRNQYMKLIDKKSGEIRVERGESSVYLGPTEEVLEDVREGINIDDHTAVLVRDITSGQLTLVTERQVFTPAANQEVVEVRKRILLEDHEVVVVKDSAGGYQFRRGSDRNRAFFLEPYTQLVKFRWSAGIHKDKRSLEVTHIDLRPKFMWYAFDARTQDNVELVIDITFFWQIVDVEAMVQTTDDVPGDVCSHARSAIIQAVSQVPLERFLAVFNQIVRRAVVDSDDPFYAERGVRLHSVEVRSITCKDAHTQRILQEIIQETTNRINRIQKQESENEIKIKQVQGEIEMERARGALLEIQRGHSAAEAQMTGEAEAQRVRAFLEGLGGDLNSGEKLGVFNTLRKQEILDRLSQGRAQLYFTPADVDLSIEAKNGVDY